MLRKGSFFPSILEPPRRIDQALHAVVMEAYVHASPPAASTTWWWRSARTPGSPSRRSRGSAPSSTSPSARSGPDRWTARRPYVYLDATYLHLRNKPGNGAQVVSMAGVVATGIAGDG